MSLFVVGTLQWAAFIVGIALPSEVAQVNPAQDTKIDLLQQQFAILDSLKNKNVDTTTHEEKLAVLAKLSENTPHTLSTTEQEQILEKLK